MQKPAVDSACSCLVGISLACLPHPVEQQDETSTFADTECATWYADEDGDGFGDAANTKFTCAPPPGWVLEASDCFDGNADARPDQVGFFAVDRGDGSYDYDCDADPVIETPGLGRCEPFPVCEFREGWRGGPPKCGEETDYYVGCDLDPMELRCQGVSERRIQRCR